MRIGKAKSAMLIGIGKDRKAVLIVINNCVVLVNKEIRKEKYGIILQYFNKKKKKKLEEIEENIEVKKRESVKLMKQRKPSIKATFFFVFT